jgi:hypothetical protein
MLQTQKMRLSDGMPLEHLEANCVSDDPPRWSAQKPTGHGWGHHDLTTRCIWKMSEGIPTECWISPTPMTSSSEFRIPLGFRLGRQCSEPKKGQITSNPSVTPRSVYESIAGNWLECCQRGEQALSSSVCFPTRILVNDCRTSKLLGSRWVDQWLIS